MYDVRCADATRIGSNARLIVEAFAAVSRSAGVTRTTSTER